MGEVKKRITKLEAAKLQGNKKFYTFTENEGGVFTPGFGDDQQAWTREQFDALAVDPENCVFIITWRNDPPAAGRP
jgi:hypothetical protein